MTRSTDIVIRGDIVDSRDELIEQLQRENDDLRRHLRDAEAKARQANVNVAHAMGNLRKQLSPLYRALQGVFGELESIGEGDATGGDIDPRTAQVWASWKSKLGTTCAKVIDALLTHGPMRNQALAIATGLNRNTVSNAVVTMNKAGLITKRDGQIGLKQL